MPVVVLNRLRVTDAASNRSAATAHAALVAEQAARVTAERSLAEVLATIRSLQAKLAHAELTHAEALAAERLARERAEATLQEMVAARETAERRLGEAEPAETAAPQARTKKSAPIKPRTAAAKTREPQPVRWWLPGYKAAKQKS